ncbi:MAG TPA: tail fiber protein [Candidatus Methylomirabilis sp.]|nr:tail fiber protein [Candidatus Methylomirabilis sp.]
MDPFVAEIRILPTNFAPTGWAFCNGQLLPISQNTALFSLLGTTYGGDGKSTFGLPNLQGSAPMFFGQGPGLSRRDSGETGGAETVTLTPAQMPSHTHSIIADSGLPTTGNPTNAVLASPAALRRYSAASDLEPMVPVGPAGGNQPHNNMQPYLTLNFCIALQGVFPPRS